MNCSTAGAAESVMLIWPGQPGALTVAVITAVPDGWWAIANPREPTLIVVGSLDVQAVTCELMSRTPVDCELFRKKFSRTASLRDLPLGIAAGFAGLMLNRTGPTAAGSCARAAETQNATRAMQTAFRQLCRCSICGNR